MVVWNDCCQIISAHHCVIAVFTLWYAARFAWYFVVHSRIHLRAYSFVHISRLAHRSNRLAETQLNKPAIKWHQPERDTQPVFDSFQMFPPRNCQPFISQWLFLSPRIHCLLQGCFWEQQMTDGCIRGPMPVRGLGRKGLSGFAQNSPRPGCGVTHRQGRCVCGLSKIGCGW